MFFSKSFVATVALCLSLSLGVNAHAAISPVLGVQGTPVRSDVQRPSNAKPCGRSADLSAIDTSTAVTPSVNGTITATITNFNRGVDGSRQVTAKVDPTGTGQSFVAATVLQNGLRNPRDLGSEQLVVQMPAGTTCTGGASGTKCLLAFTTAGRFGNCIVVDQAGTTGTGAATGTGATGTDATGTDTTGTDTTGTDTTGTDTTGTDATGTDATGTDATGTGDATNTDTAAATGTATGTDGTVDSAASSAAATATTDVATSTTTTTTKTGGRGKKANGNNANGNANDATGTDATGTDANSTDANANDATANDVNTNANANNAQGTTRGQQASRLTQFLQGHRQNRAFGTRAARVARRAAERPAVEVIA